MRSRRLLPVAALIALISSVTAAEAVAPPNELRVFAASSLSSAFSEIARKFEGTHPGTTVRLNLAGSQQLATQVEQGAVADVFASADQRWMDYLRERSLVEGPSDAFARNVLTVILPRTNPARISRLQDLARPGIKLVIGAETVPVGRYGRELLQRLSKLPGFSSDYATRTLRNVVSEEENVKAVVSKVQLGEADAGIVYRSDATGQVARYVKTLAVPDSVNVTAEYPIAVLSGARHKEAARKFIELVMSDEAQTILEQRGLIRVATRP